MKNSKSKTAILYCRTNVKNKKEASKQLSIQLKRLTEYCGNQHIPVAYIAKERASGISNEPAELSDILRLIESGKLKSGLLLVTSWCRLTRSGSIGIKLISQLAFLKVTVVALDSETSHAMKTNIGYNFSNYLPIVFKNQHKESHSQKIKAGIAAARVRRAQQ